MFSPKAKLAMKKIFLALLFVPIILSQSCNLLDIFPTACQEYIPQKYKLGDQQVHISTSKKEMHVGDTVFAKMRFDLNVFDSLSKKKISVNGKVNLWLPLQTAISSPSSSIFAMDTSIHKIFNQYFETIVAVGQQRSTYSFDCARVGGYWELDVRYIVKKRGVFEIYPFLSELSTNERLPKGVCMLGNSTYDSKVYLVSTNNRIRDLYQVMPAGYENHFGFLVE